MHVEIVGYDGDGAEEPGHDRTYQTAYGTLVPSTMPTVPAIDLLGSERASAVALAALLGRAAAGPGGRHRISLEDCARLAGKAVLHGLMGEGAPLGGGMPEYRIYPTADGNIALGALEPHFADRVHQHLGTTRQQIASTLADRPTSHWEDLAARLDILLTRIVTITSSAKAAQS